MTHTLRLPDARMLAWAEYGDRHGRPLVLLHGVPGSRVLPGVLGPAAQREGVRLIVPDRPGYGRSDPDPSSGFLPYCGDLRVLLDHLNLERVTVAGISGGAGYAVAAAHRLADRLHAVLLVSGMAVPIGPHRPPPGTGSAVEALLARHTPWLLRLVFGAGLGTLARLGPRAIGPMLGAGQRWLAGPLAADAREALRQGPRAAVADLRRYHAGRPDIPAAAVTVPVAVLHGAADRSVPLAAARWVHHVLPTSTLTVIGDAGHLIAFTEPGLLPRRVPG